MWFCKSRQFKVSDSIIQIVFVFFNSIIQTNSISERKKIKRVRNT